MAYRPDSNVWLGLLLQYTKVAEILFIITVGLRNRSIIKDTILSILLYVMIRSTLLWMHYASNMFLKKFHLLNLKPVNYNYNINILNNTHIKLRHCH